MGDIYSYHTLVLCELHFCAEMGPCRLICKVLTVVKSGLHCCVGPDICGDHFKKNLLPFLCVVEIHDCVYCLVMSTV